MSKKAAGRFWPDVIHARSGSGQLYVAQKMFGRTHTIQAQTERMMARLQKVQKKLQYRLDRCEQYRLIIQDINATKDRFLTPDRAKLLRDAKEGLQYEITRIERDREYAKKYIQDISLIWVNGGASPLKYPIFDMFKDGGIYDMSKAKKG